MSRKETVTHSVPLTPTPQIIPINEVTSSTSKHTINIPHTLDDNAIHSSLELLKTSGIQRRIETNILKLDKSTPKQRELEEKRITIRIQRIDILIVCLTFYTALAMQWLTLLGLSTSFSNFLFELFIKSFDLTQWNFSEIQTIGKISGVTTSLQFIFSIISNFIMILLKIFYHAKNIPISLKGPIYFGGLFRFFNIFRPKINDNHLAVKKIDAKFHQYLGILSNSLIIITAIIIACDKLTMINIITSEDVNTLLSGLIDKSNILSRDVVFNQTAIQSQNATEVALSVKHAAIFTKTTLMVSILAIIMTSLLNIINWLREIWQANHDNIIVYEMFKWFTRLIVCNPCCGNKSASNDMSEEEFNMVNAKLDDKIAKYNRANMRNNRVNMRNNREFH
ncbi:10694_t:CDS:1 [Cetraspora pellucida]|uniref:10694_t:CDS:1 n=1 Tax=Cetraspora pellucida TaxID=1433469 RepID=A0ACA9MHE9_9GLOM|nr:10694_t:CDS:1 [Cetraspora pellucida]